MNNLVHYQARNKDAQPVITLTSNCIKLKRAEIVAKVSQTSTGIEFAHTWAIPNDIPTYVLIDNALHVISKPSAHLPPKEDMKHLAKNFDHPETNSQVVSSKSTIVM